MAFQNQQFVKDKVNYRTDVKILNLILKLPQQHNEINMHTFSGNVDLCKLLK